MINRLWSGMAVAFGVLLSIIVVIACIIANLALILFSFDYINKLIGQHSGDVAGYLITTFIVIILWAFIFGFASSYKQN